MFGFSLRRNSRSSVCKGRLATAPSPIAHRVRSVPLVLALALTVSACGGGETADADRPLKLGIFENFSTYYAGKASGAFTGVDLETTVIDSGPAALPLVKRGELDGIDEAGVVPTLIAQATGVPVKVVWLTSNYRYRFVVDQAITSPAQLTGKTIATVPGSVLEFYLDRYLTENGLSPNDVNKVDLPPPSMPSALKTQQIDGALVWDPFAATMIDYGGHAMASVDDLALVLMSEASISSQPARVQQLVCALSRTQDGFLADPATGYQAIGDALKMPAEEVQANMPTEFVFANKQAAAYLTPGSSEFTSLTMLLEEAGAWLAAKGTITAPPSSDEVTGLLDDSFARVVADGGC